MSLRSHAGAAFLYAVLTVVMTWPLASRLNLMEAGDSSYFAWVMAWTTRALLNDPLGLPHANTLHPLRYTLFLDEPIVATSILSLPLRLLTSDPIVTLNVVRLLTFFLSALGVRALGLSLGLSPLAAFAVGALFSFSSNRVSSPAHLSVLGTQFLPLYFLFLHRWARTGSARPAALAGLFFGHEAAQGALSQNMESLVGKASAEAIQGLVASASGKKSGLIASIGGIIAILFGATGVFAELQESLNNIWKAPPLKINRVVGFFRTRFLSFSVVLGVGFLLLVSLMISVGLSSFCGWSGQCDESFGRVAAWAVGFGVTTLLFALIFKLLPDVKVAWRHVWQGALLTAVLFTIGRTILGWVLSQTSILSAYGTAASLAALLLWVHYSSLILLLGAELSYVIANRAGAKPEEHVDAPWAEPVDPAREPVAHGMQPHAHLTQKGTSHA